MDLAKIAKKGDNLETLRALRQRIAETIDATKSGRDIAALSRQLQIVMSQIAELEQQEEIDSGDTVLKQILEKHKAQAVRDAQGRGTYAVDD